MGTRLGVMVVVVVSVDVDGVGEVVVGGVVVTGFVPTLFLSWSIVFVPVLESLPGNELLLLSATAGVVFIIPVDTSKGTIFVS